VGFLRISDRVRIENGVKIMFKRDVDWKGVQSWNVVDWMEKRVCNWFEVEENGGDYTYAIHVNPGAGDGLDVIWAENVDRQIHGQLTIRINRNHRNKLLYCVTSNKQVVMRTIINVHRWVYRRLLKWCKEMHDSD
jgi:hypothetical protein